jgi:hypothetical protein
MHVETEKYKVINFITAVFATRKRKFQLIFILGRSSPITISV